MRIGLDLDNTLACYDHTFEVLAAQEPDLPRELPRTKTDLRNHLRRVGRECRWTELQGEAYGPGMQFAQPYAGVVNFIRNARVRGERLVIISQRSTVPFAGQPHDLHTSARRWIRTHLHDLNGPLFSDNDIFFEPDRESKVARIAACGCDVFVDDLPEVLEHPSFPTATRRYHFIPSGRDGAARTARLLSRWEAFEPWMEV